VAGTFIGADMARWINQTFHVSKDAEIVLCEDLVIIQIADNQGWDGYATFEPKSEEDARTQALALRLAAKHIEDIGKGLK
jgi:hypothetical protein